MQQQEQFILEYYKVNNLLKVSAIDPKSGVEVSVFGAVSCSREFITGLAIQKLKFQLNKKTITPASLE